MSIRNLSIAISCSYAFKVIFGNYTKAYIRRDMFTRLNWLTPLNVILATVCCLSAANSVQADERRFTYVYEPNVLPEGELEFEQWLTNKAGRDGGDYSRWDFREELEYGITNNLTTAVYLNFRDTYWSPEDTTQSEERDFEFRGISSEWKYQVLNPHTDAIGLVVYGEATIGSDEAELEEQLIIGKEFADSWSWAFNTKIEQAWEFEHGSTEKESKLVLSTGISYKYCPEWAVGLELFNERTFEGIDLDESEAEAWYMGPNIHYGSGKWWLTLTVAPQVPFEGDRDLDSFERVQSRLIAGIIF